MTIPADVVKSVWDSLTVTIHELHDLPHITLPNERILGQALTSLNDVLSKCTYESWTATEANSALQTLKDALQKTSSLALKWKKRRIRLVLDKSTFVDELSNAVMVIQKSCGKLQARQNHREAARAIGEQLGIVAQGLRGGGSGSDSNTAEAEFKKELLAFLRVKSKTPEDAISVVAWLAKHLGTDVHSIKQELQEIKENADTLWNAKREVETQLLEQLLLSLTELEDESVILAKTKAQLICSLCDSRMVFPVMIDSGLSFCKACVEERFLCGYMTCPGTDAIVSNHFVANFTLQKVVACFGEAEEQPAGDPSTEEGESSDVSLDSHASDESLERKAQMGLEYLDSASYQKVLAGFNRLIKCAASPGGPLAVFNAKYTRPPPAPPAPAIVIEAIPAVIEKAKKQDPQYSRLAVKLMAALTSDKRGASENGGGPDSEIILEVADALDVLVSLMKEERLTRTRLLAAETVANILVNKEVRKMVRSYDGIVPALVAFSNVDPAGQSTKDLDRAYTVCLKGLQRLAKCSKRGDKTQMIVSALIKLLKRGLSYQPELRSLVRDSLVALESQVQDHATSTNKVCQVVWKEISELMEANAGAFVSHTTVSGKMAIINILTKLCCLYKDNIDKSTFLYLLKTIKSTRAEIVSLVESPQEGAVAEQQLRSLTDLLVRSVRLLCFCVTHGKNTAQHVLREYVEERSTLEELLRHGETSGIFDESRLEILSILDQIDTLSSIQATEVEILVEVSKSKSQSCRQQVARRLRMLVERKQHLTEFKDAGGIAALLELLEDPDVKCQRDALVALQALPPSMAIPVGQLPLQTILNFLSQKGHTDGVSNAAVGLFDLMVKDKAVSAEKFLKTEGALEAILNLLDRNPDSPGSLKSASALLEMAKEDASVRAHIAEPGLRGLHILVKYVRDHSPNRFKELLTTTLVLFCRDGEPCQEAVITADGHEFLLTSLQEKIAKEIAAQGLLELLNNTNTSERVLEAGFVPIAVRSIDGRFACTAIALGLSRISSTQEGLNQVSADSHSVSALLTLLEHCPDSSGKNAAALVIARVYPLLCRKDDVTRQTKIAEACDLLLRYLNPLHKHPSKEFLEALVAVAAEMKGRKMIHEYRGHMLLIQNLSVKDTEIQGLVLKILSEMSSDVSENGVETRDAKRIRYAFMENRVGEKLFDLVRSEEFSRRTESMKDALILIRNLSLAGSYACEQLAEEGAVNVLLEVLKRHDNSLSIVTELAVKALVKFLDDPKGKQAFLRGGGIKSLVAILKLDVFGRTGDVSTIILTAVAKDPQHRKEACRAIFDCDILMALNEIIFDGETSRIRWQAAVLMKLLAMYGPTSRVCVAIRDKGCIDALIQLRGVQHCQEMANDVLKYVGENNSQCKKYIDMRLALDK